MRPPYAGRLTLMDDLVSHVGPLIESLLWVSVTLLDKNTPHVSRIASQTRDRGGHALRAKLARLILEVFHNRVVYACETQLPGIQKGNLQGQSRDFLLNARQDIPQTLPRRSLRDLRDESLS